MDEKANSNWQLIDAVIGVARRVLLHGAPGVGKSFAGRRAATALGLPMYHVTLTEETPAAEIRGSFMPCDGGFKWFDGVGIKAWRDGGLLILDEINEGSGDVATLLYALCDDTKVAAITLPTGETVKPHKDFRVLATMNGDPRELPEALRDRFPVTIQIDEIHPAAFDALPNEVRALAQSGAIAEEGRRIGIRKWNAYVELAKVLGAEVAAPAVFGVNAESILDSIRLASAKVGE